MLTEIEAPPFKEQKRAEAFLARLQALGLTNAAIDAEGNVVGIRKGTGNGPKLVISAHLDTVFPSGTDVKVKERDGKLYAPGISDNTRGLAVLLSWLKVLNDQKIATVGDLVFVGNVGEEELGNLRGMKHLFKEHLDIDGMVALEPAPDGTVLVLGTGSHRHEVTFKGPGGHSFGAFGLSNPIHAMGRAVEKISKVSFWSSGRDGRMRQRKPMKPASISSTIAMNTNSEPSPQRSMAKEAISGPNTAAAPKQPSSTP